jgi:hypothetical protein
MRTYDLISKVAGEVLRSHPLPETFEELDAATRRKIEREAGLQDLTPAALYAVIRAQRDEELAKGTRTDELLAEVRRRRLR